MKSPISITKSPNILVWLDTGNRTTEKYYFHKTDEKINQTGSILLWKPISQPWKDGFAFSRQDERRYLNEPLKS